MYTVSILNISPYSSKIPFSFILYDTNTISIFHLIYIAIMLIIINVLKNVNGKTKITVEVTTKDEDIDVVHNIICIYTYTCVL